MALKVGSTFSGPLNVNNTATGNTVAANGVINIVTGDSENPTILSTVVVSPYALLGNQTAYVDLTVPVASLASAGKVNVQVAGSATAQYKIRSVVVRYSAAGLSGNSGNRLLAISDGTIVWTGSGITASLLGTPINTVWGGTGLPLPASTDMSVASTAGANIFVQYTGGTTDYNAGSVSLSIELQQVTA